MATAKKDSTPVKMTPTQMRKKIESLEQQVEVLKDKAYCYMCKKQKNKADFYVNTDPRVPDGISITPICKTCAKDLALRKDKNGEYHEPTKESIQLALYYLNKPFIESLYNSSIQESSNLNAGSVKTNAWTAYAKSLPRKSAATLL